MSRENDVCIQLIRDDDSRSTIDSLKWSSLGTGVDVETATAAASSETTSKVIWFVRHGNALHNKKFAEAGNDPAVYFDEANSFSILTDKGRDQVETLRTSDIWARAATGIEAVYTSPLIRCIQTSDLLFDHPKTHTRPHIADPLLRERNGLHPCNRFLRRSVLKMTAPHVNIDRITSEVDEDYNPDIRESWESVEHRAKSFFVNVCREPYTEVCAVTHHDFLLAAITRDIPGVHVVNRAECKDPTFPNAACQGVVVQIVS
jgi:broad specificity phosphatase PhoE